ncbi:MAG: DNA-binding response regulator [Chloroflexi bacterium]|nr:MAG: DNA-binding response regulator [Chloroflexota bacterium]
MTSRVLIVDDEPVVRSFLVRVLEQAGYTVQAAHHGRDALQRLQAAPFDVLLTDIKMDQLDGVQLLARARAQYPDMAVILLTGHATVQSAVEALRLGAHDYLLKPAKNEDILAAVASGLAARARQRRTARLEQVAGEMLRVLQDDPTTTLPDTPVISCGPLQIDPEAYRATLNDNPLNLTPTEFRLLAAFAREPGTAINYVRLVQLACGYTCSRQEAREIIGTHVRNVRKKLGVTPRQPLYIESVRGVGYRLIP